MARLLLHAAIRRRHGARDLNSRARARLALVLLFAAVTATAAEHAAEQMEDAVRYRQGIMNAMAWNVAPLAYMVKGDHRFDDARFTVLAARTAVLATMALEGFSPDTAGARSLASPALWQNYDDFSRRMHELEALSSSLAKAAQRGDQAQMRVLFGDTVRSCKACHDLYQRSE